MPAFQVTHYRTFDKVFPQPPPHSGIPDFYSHHNWIGALTPFLLINPEPASRASICVFSVTHPYPLSHLPPTLEPEAGLKSGFWYVLLFIIASVIVVAMRVATDVNLQICTYLSITLSRNIAVFLCAARFLVGS